MPLSPGSTHTNNDDNLNGYLHLFNPSNTTSAINAFQFKFNSGNIDSGTVKLYGVT